MIFSLNSTLTKQYILIIIRYSYDLEVALKELEDREEVLRSQLQKISIEKEALQKVVDNVWKIDEDKEK